MCTATKEKSSSMPTSVYIEHDWTPEEELQLFYALENLRFRPVGINKHFYMACLSEKLNVPGDIIWRHLNTIAKMKELDELESLPFPNEEREFSLPDQDFGCLKQKKCTAREEQIAQQSARSQNSENTCITSATINASIIAVATDSNGKITEKSSSGVNTKANYIQQQKDLERRLTPKLMDLPKRPMKRTRNSMSNDSPSTTPPPHQNNKRRRI